MMNTTVHGYHPEKSLIRRARRLLNRMPPVRNAIIYGLSRGKDPRVTRNWVRFPMYHDIPPRDRGGFERQLEYMKTIGEFLTVDDAVGLLEKGDPIDGRYICVTFDDGLEACHSNALPILQRLGVPAVFFVVAKWVNQASDPSALDGKEAEDLGPAGLGYLTWAQCRAMSEGGMTIGSHTYAHRNLWTLGDDEVREELEKSKRVIESNLQMECRHFACPWGQPNEAFKPERDPELARSVGYRSFFTTVRGWANEDSSVHLLPREKVEPEWGTYHLKYFFSL